MASCSDIRNKLLKTGNVRMLKLFHSWRDLATKVKDLQDFACCFIFHAANSEERNDFLEIKSDLHYFLISMNRNQPTLTSDEYPYILYIRFLHDRIALFMDKMLDLDKKHANSRVTKIQSDLSIKLLSLRTKFYEEESE